MSRGNVRVGAGVVALIAALAITTSHSATAAPAPVLWPGDGRMLAGSLVIGGSIVGEGSLEVVNGVITRATASVDTAPAELSLRMVTFVPDRDGGGYSAVLRYRVPIVQLHVWRETAVRMTQTVVLRPPSGQTQAVQIQADGTTAVGTYGADRKFAPTGGSDGRIVGNVAVIHVPSSVGVTPDWTVQAIVEVTADAPFHTFRPATGYVAGTSIVPVGLLTGETQATPAATAGIADALTTLAPAPLPGADKPNPPDGVRVTGVRVEGTGTDQAVVVTTAGSPLDVPADLRGHINVWLTPPRFSSIDDPFGVSWTGGADNEAAIGVDGLPLGTVHVTVTGTETRFAIGKVVAAPPITIPAGSRFDTLNGSIVVTLRADGDIVKSSDGVSVVPPVPDEITVAFNGPNVAVIHPSTNSTATGFVSADGHFVALNATEHFVGFVDKFGDSVVQLSRILSPGEQLRRSSIAPQIVPAGDYTTTALGGSSPYEVAMAFLKGLGPLAGISLDSTALPALDLNWMTGQPLSTDTFSATGQPSGAQGGQPDWPLTPVSDAVAATSGFLVSVTAGTFDAGFPTELVTPWTASSLLAAAPVVVPPAVVASTTNATTAVTTARDTTGAVAAVVTASGSDDSSSTTIVIAILVLLVVAGVVAVAMTRRRRSPSALPIPAEPLPVIRTAPGHRTTSVSQPVQGWSIGVRTTPGQRVTSGRVIEPEDHRP